MNRTRSRWRRLLCWLGLHEGPITLWYPHVNECEACHRTVLD